ncbi:S9 family peptidase [bacterium]|nr:S9 family peptidase [bacterium]
MKYGIIVTTFVVLCLLLFQSADLMGEQKRAITFDDLISFGRVGNFEISPNGKNVAFTVTWFNKEENSSTKNIYLASVKDGNPRIFVKSDGNDYAPCWSPDGKEIAFISDRGGDPQIWIIPTSGGEARRVTDIPTGVSNPIWSPDGKTLAFTSNIYPECSNMACNREKLEEFKNSKVKARIINRLMYRHWNTWREGRWSHLFLTDTEGSTPIEINKGETDVPPIALGGERDYCFAPDGKELCFTMNPDPVIATSTNNDIYIMTLPNGVSKSITGENPSNDNNPRYSPDGKFIAYRAQFVPGFEADRHRLMLYNRKTGKTSNLTENFDYSINKFTWGPKSKNIYFNAEKHGRICIGKASIKGGDAGFLISDNFNMNLRITPNGKEIIFSRQDVSHPTELYRSTIEGKNITQLTDINGELLNKLQMNPIEEFWFKGAESKDVHGLLVKPPFFDKNSKYPLIVLIHGGPQGAFGDEFHYRWNIQMFASPGYIVTMFNFTGSTGYGQEFTNAIS